MATLQGMQSTPAPVGAGSNFSSGEGDKKAADFKGTSFGYSGDKVVSQRDIQRLVRPLRKPYILMAKAGSRCSSDKVAAMTLCACVRPPGHAAGIPIPDPQASKVFAAGLAAI